jgi:hypothetical protein
MKRSMTKLLHGVLGAAVGLALVGAAAPARAASYTCQNLNGININLGDVGARINSSTTTGTVSQPGYFDSDGRGIFGWVPSGQYYNLNVNVGVFDISDTRCDTITTYLEIWVNPPNATGGLMNGTYHVIHSYTDTCSTGTTRFAGMKNFGFNGMSASVVEYHISVFKTTGLIAEKWGNVSVFDTASNPSCGIY